MITEKQKYMAEQAVYGDLKVLDRDNELWTYAGLGLSELMEGNCALYDDNENVMYDWIDEVKPILRPMSDLTKEITHEGYNDGKPFIPLVELAKIAQGAKTTDHFKLVGDVVINFTIAYHFKQNVSWFQSLQGEKQVYILPNQNKFFDLLNQLHFDTRNLIATNEAIDVNSLPNNPYEV